MGEMNKKIIIEFFVAISQEPNLSKAESEALVKITIFEKNRTAYK